MKKALKTILALSIIGILAYKAYRYFTKPEEDDVVDGEIIDELDEEPAGGDEKPKGESLAEKIKAAAKRAVG